MTTMTRQHYETIAGKLRQMKEKYGIEINYKILCIEFADMLQETNPRFNRDRFLTACDILKEGE